MDTNDKHELSPAERKRKMAARRRHQEELKRRKRRRALVIVLLVILAAALIAGIVFAVRKLTAGGSAEIAAKGDTFVIAIDPGHGGEDIGMSNEVIEEKEVDLNICAKLKIMLESQGYQVVMTREDDTRVSKEDRVSTANTSGADLLVSVHCNYAEDDSAKTGVTVNYTDGDKESRTLAENIDSALVKETNATDNGISAGSYSITDDTEMPAVLVEVGYLSNAEESNSLAEDVYQNSVAKGIAKGVILSLKR
ncbi:N-acetylmuramoyl-L-alanine amidase [Anaerosacchariphilus sp. NSJ-68]|uniref:N-acetylmuramoyl-L-alanine amidase n=2 Tax=Lachnospiraceae TaxID=186803 RepID=A0A923RM03_9FIRM|nr:MULTISPECIES: N-acetylmuramoyl-L-alanine amidase [Lachnospiraceae]MBC5659783.1 N-acetylmuramoyl-L-alanine amidase [Anaerosacchariphilus hominis]